MYQEAFVCTLVLEYVCIIRDLCMWTYVLTGMCVKTRTSLFISTETCLALFFCRCSSRRARYFQVFVCLYSFCSCICVYACACMRDCLHAGVYVRVCVCDCMYIHTDMYLFLFFCVEPCPADSSSSWRDLSHCQMHTTFKQDTYGIQIRYIRYSIRYFLKTNTALHPVFKSDNTALY